VRLPKERRQLFDAVQWAEVGKDCVAESAREIVKLGRIEAPKFNGQPTYRILRTQPEGVGTMTTVADVADQSTKVYTIGTNGDGSTATTYPNNYFREITNTGQYASAFNTSMSAWCAQCHGRHTAPSGSWGVDSGDANYKFRHPSGLGASVNCASCHVAHGSSSTMSGAAASVDLPDGSGHEDSALLRLNNRGVCENCHAGGRFIAPQINVVQVGGGNVTVYGLRLGAAGTGNSVQILGPVVPPATSSTIVAATVTPTTWTASQIVFAPAGLTTGSTYQVKVVLANKPASFSNPSSAKNFVAP
jgi:hypothetical protein